MSAPIPLSHGTVTTTIRTCTVLDNQTFGRTFSYFYLTYCRMWLPQKEYVRSTMDTCAIFLAGGPLSLPPSQRLSVSASQRLSVSTSQRLNVSASPRLSVSALYHVPKVVRSSAPSLTNMLRDISACMGPTSRSFYSMHTGLYREMQSYTGKY